MKSAEILDRRTDISLLERTVFYVASSVVLLLFWQVSHLVNIWT